MGGSRTVAGRGVGCGCWAGRNRWQSQPRFGKIPVPGGSARSTAKIGRERAAHTGLIIFRRPASSSSSALLRQIRGGTPVRMRRRKSRHMLRRTGRLRFACGGEGVRSLSAAACVALVTASAQAAQTARRIARLLCGPVVWHGTAWHVPDDVAMSPAPPGYVQHVARGMLHVALLNVARLQGAPSMPHVAICMPCALHRSSHVARCR
jgi:hypothetical protein